METEKAKDMAHDLMHQHGLEHWYFKFDGAKKRFGVCNYRTKTISLSRILTEMNDVKHVKDTILHEIAHALVGPIAGHGPVWKMKAKEIGASPTRCAHDDVKVPEAKYIMECKTCKKQISFYKRPKNKRACKQCCDKYAGGMFNDKYLFSYYKLEA